MDNKIKQKKTKELKVKVPKTKDKKTKKEFQIIVDRCPSPISVT